MKLIYKLFLNKLYKKYKHLGLNVLYNVIDNMKAPTINDKEEFKKYLKERSDL